MKKKLKSYWQLLILPVLYIPYNLLNTKVIVKWLGCGCPQIDENGNEIVNRFNANHFSQLFWAIMALTVIVISLVQIKKLQKWQYKLLYIGLISIGSLWLAGSFYKSMIWN